MGPLANSYWVPGTRLAGGEYPGGGDPAAAREQIGRLLDVGVTVIIDLTERGELTPYDALLTREAMSRGMRVAYHRRPVRELASTAPAEIRAVLAIIDGALRSGGVVYVHCRFGAGRTGMVVGCHLVASGRAPADALAEVARLFGAMTPERTREFPADSAMTATQRSIVDAWVRTVPGGATGDAARVPRPEGEGHTTRGLEET